MILARLSDFSEIYYCKNQGSSSDLSKTPREVDVFFDTCQHLPAIIIGKFDEFQHLLAIIIGKFDEFQHLPAKINVFVVHLGGLGKVFVNACS